MILAVAYLGIGVVFAPAFLSVGAQRLDPAARGSSLAFRALVFPGCVALWPWLAMKWLRGEHEVDARRNGVMTRTLRQWHRRIWIVLAILLPVLFFAGLLVRGDLPR